MNRRTIHENLSTSFVDVEALVRHLRELQFVGSIRIELCGYEADIIFTPNNRLQAREHDRATGVRDQGEAAFKRILARSRESHGRLNVYQSVQEPLGVQARKVHVDALIAARARMTVKGSSDSPAPHLIPRFQPRAEESGDWDTLLNLTAELLRTVDRSLERAGLPFAEAFENACAIVAQECPFIDPNRGLFEYSGGSVRVDAAVSKELFLNAVLKALGRIFDRLREEPSLSKLHTFTKHQVAALTISRRDQYETLGIAQGLRSLLER